MQSFGTLLRQLRGDTPVTELARRSGLPKSYLVNLEAGRKIPTEKQARRLLARAFDLTESEVSRSLLHVQLMDYGLQDEALRQLVIELVEHPTLLVDWSHRLSRRRRTRKIGTAGTSPDGAA